MDKDQLNAEGFYSIYGKVGARTEMPGCSFVHGQSGARQGANVYLASAELAAIASILGKLPSKAEYMELYNSLASKKDQTYSYLNFDQYEDCTKKAKDVGIDADVRAGAKKAYAAQYA